MIGAVGDDPLADEALGRARRGRRRARRSSGTGQTGVALIYVDLTGENEIAVFPGANAELTPREVEGAVLCQLEVPDEVVLRGRREGVVLRAERGARRGSSISSPTCSSSTELEHEVVKRGKLVAVTDGANGAVLFEDGKQVAGSAPPQIVPVDGDRRRRCVHRVPARRRCSRSSRTRRRCTGARASPAPTQRRRSARRASLPDAVDGLEAWLKTIHG